MKQIILLYLSMLGIWDYRKKSVPVLFLIVGSVLLSGIAVFRYAEGELSGMEILFGILPGVFVLFIAWVTGKVGYADGIVLVQLGVCLGYRKGVVLFCGSMLLLLLCCILLICLKKVGRNTKIPYFPFLAFAYLIQNL